MVNFWFRKYINNENIITKKVLKNYKYSYFTIEILKFILLLCGLFIVKDSIFLFLFITFFLPDFKLREPYIYTKKNSENNSIIEEDKSVIKQKAKVSYIKNFNMDGLLLDTDKYLKYIERNNINKISYWKYGKKIWNLNNNSKFLKYYLENETTKESKKIIELTQYKVEPEDSDRKYSNEFDKYNYNIKIIETWCY